MQYDYETELSKLKAEGERLDVQLKRGIFFLALTLTLMFASCGVDNLQEYRAFDSKMACKQQWKSFERKPFTSHVVCLPVLSRQDTTTINLNK